MTITRARTYGVIGQSYGREGQQASDGYAAFMAAISQAIEASAATIQTNIGGSPTIASGQLFGRWNGAVDGSAVWQGHAGSAGYWVNTDAASAGPLLTSAIAAIGALSAKPILLIDSHGEQDATAMDGANNAATVRTAWEYKLAQVRAACNAVTPTDVPVWVDMLGPRYSADALDRFAIRDAMIAMVDAGTNLFRGAEKYAAVLDSTMHPAEDLTGYGRLGAWLGRKVAHWLISGTDLRGPSISGATRSGNSVTVSVSVPSGATLIKPAAPDYFGLFDGSNNQLPITGYSWSGNDLTLSCASTPSQLRYPVAQARRCDINRVIRLSAPSSPVFAGEPGLPLESTTTLIV